MNYRGEVEYPVELNGYAERIGALRADMNVETRKKNPEQARGGNEAAIDSLGVLGELIVRHHLHAKKGLKWRTAPLLELYPVPLADLVIGDFFYDIKTVRPGSGFFRVNKRAHHANRRVTHYLFVVPLGNTAKMYSCQRSEVETWPIVELAYEPAYQIEIEKAADGTHKKIERCEDCGGDGYYYTRNPGDDNMNEEKTSCERCGGTGTVAVIEPCT